MTTPSANDPVVGSIQPATPAHSLTDLNNKRTAAITGDRAAPQSYKRRRAARACLSCRQRKVRCNAIDGSPCLNCRSDHLECIIQNDRPTKGTTKRSRRRHILPTEMQFCYHPSSVDTPKGTVAGDDSRRKTNENPSSTQTAPNSNGTSPQSINTGEGLSLCVQCGGRYSHDPAVLRQICLSEAAPNSTMKAASMQNPSSGADGPVTLFLKSLDIQEAISRLPSFLKALPTTMDPETVQYLHKVGALTLPGSALQNALLQAYIEHVHIAIPFLDLQDFLDAIYGHHSHSVKTSLLLFQSIMFAGTAFVDMRYLQEDGYKTRRDARRQFFQRTKVLYDSDYEESPLVALQALLQMTYWDASPGDQKQAWYWMGLAVSLSYNIGLHRQDSYLAYTASQQRMRRRLWWCCFIRDRIIALEMRRPPIIEDASFNVPGLALGDFDSGALPERTTMIVTSDSWIKDSKRQHDAIRICIARVELCALIGSVLKARFTPPGPHETLGSNTTSHRKPHSDGSHVGVYESANHMMPELSMWADSLPSCCQYQPLTISNTRGVGITISVQRVLLHMLYHVTQWVFHTQYPTPGPDGKGNKLFLHTGEGSWMMVQRAAERVTQFTIELHQFQLYKFLPSITVTSMMPSIVINLVEMQGPSPSSRIHAAESLRQCILVLEQLRGTYSTAYAAAWFINAALRKAPLDAAFMSAHPIISLMRSDLSLALFLQQCSSGTASDSDETGSLPPALDIDSWAVVNTPETLDLPVVEPSANPSTSYVITPPYQQTFPVGSEVAVGLPDASAMHALRGAEGVSWESKAGTNFDAELWLGVHDSGVFASQSNFGDCHSNMVISGMEPCT